jgi:hypothetical protein
MTAAEFAKVETFSKRLARAKAPSRARC